MFGNKERDERIEKLGKKFIELSNTLNSTRYRLGEMQKIGKRRMKPSDIKEGVTAWLEIEHVLYRETIERNNTPFKDMFPYEWCYAVGGPWGHIKFDIEKGKWWVEDKPKGKKK